MAELAAYIQRPSANDGRFARSYRGTVGAQEFDDDMKVRASRSDKLHAVVPLLGNAATTATSENGPVAITQ